MRGGLVDVLCHLDDARMSDARAALAGAKRAGVDDVVSAGVNPLVDAARVTDGGEGLPRVWRAYGIHPREADRLASLDEALAVLDERLGADDVVAVGEIGLDKRPGMPDLARQQSILEAQLELARRRRLPVILHCVRAPGRLLDVLGAFGPLPRGGFVHGYGGAPELVERWLSLGISLSFGALVGNVRARHAREAARVVPRAHLLVESDAPEHPLERLPHVVETIAALRGEAVDDVAQASAANARSLLLESRGRC